MSIYTQEPMCHFPQPKLFLNSHILLPLPMNIWRHQMFILLQPRNLAQDLQPEPPHVLLLSALQMIAKLPLEFLPHLFPFTAHSCCFYHLSSYADFKSHPLEFRLVNIPNSSICFSPNSQIQAWFYSQCTYLFWLPFLQGLTSSLPHRLKSDATDQSQQVLMEHNQLLCFLQEPPLYHTIHSKNTLGYLCHPTSFTDLFHALLEPSLVIILPPNTFFPNQACYSLVPMASSPTQSGHLEFEVANF